MSSTQFSHLRAVPPPRYFDRPNRGTRNLAQSIIELILDLGLEIEDPMPTEPELMRELGVGRNMLREAMKTLQALGVIDIRHGLGTFVGRTPLDALADGLVFRGRRSIRGDLRDARELIEVRAALESSLIIQVVGEAGPEDLEQVRAIVEQMEATAEATAVEAIEDGGDGFTRLDASFHEALFRPLGNEILSELLAAFWRVHYALAAEFSASSPRDLAETAATHRKIYDAVAGGDGDVARQAMWNHFNGLRIRLAQEALAAGSKRSRPEAPSPSKPSPESAS